MKDEIVEDDTLGPLLHREAPTFEAAIYIGGDAQEVERHCQEWVDDRPRCVTVEALNFVYTGGSEPGIRVKLINYPRFPASAEEIRGEARRLGMFLLARLAQTSFSIVASDRTEWFSRRPADIAPRAADRA